MCVNCKPGPTMNFMLVFSACRVCELIDGDKKSKGVVFCDACNAYICQDCYGRPARRAAAALKDVKEKLFTRRKVDEDYNKKPDDNYSTK